MTRLASHWLVLAAALAAAGSATACEPALLRLILGRDIQGEFEATTRALSAELLEAGRAARAGDLPGLRRHAAAFLDDWQAQYTKVYLSAPTGHQDGPAWRARCDALTTRALDLKPERLPGDLEQVHPVLQDLQDHLAAFYLPEPGSGGLVQDFEVARALAKDLDAAAAGLGAEAAATGRRLDRLEARVAQTVSDGPAWREFQARLGVIRGALGRDAPPPKIADAVEALRTATLAKLWFSEGTQ